MLFEHEIKVAASEAIENLYGVKIDASAISVQQTKKEFEGDLTVIIFALTKQLKKSPQEIGEQLGEFLVENSDLVSNSNLIKGFLNLTIADKYWLEAISKFRKEDLLPVDKSADIKDTVLVEYSSPNTNKPLHLGHIRNNLLGFSVAELLKAVGNNVIKTNIVNDRGIHICKSMLAWEKFGNSETPESTGIKGDHLVGKYYVRFDQEYKKEIARLVSDGLTEDEAKAKAPLILETQKMLRDWEAGDKKVLDLWSKLNAWVYDGFDVTYKKLGVDFDKIYYESDTFLIGKKMVEEGLGKGILFKKDDGSVWIDLADEKLDQKLLLRSDGTAVYITQDLGTAWLRYKDYKFKKMIYVVGNEQDYHFKVLKIILRKLGYEWADSLFHLNYNMVDLPSGKMKSREGTVVDADELMQEMVAEAKKITSELGKVDEFSEEELDVLYETIGMGALKYYMLKVDPEKRMLFNPEESIDFNGNTGPFIQYTYARIRSVIRKGNGLDSLSQWSKLERLDKSDLESKERDLVILLLQFPELLHEAAAKYSPAVLANYTYDLAKGFNQFYHECPIADESLVDQSKFRLAIANEAGRVIQATMILLGIAVPDRM